jgi:hypothetical protein
MSLNLGFELEARVELIKIREHYRAIDPGLATDFDEEFNQIIKDIFQFPESLSFHRRQHQARSDGAFPLPDLLDR